MALVERVNGTVLWANAHLLFWLSLTPLAAAWLGPHLRAGGPVEIYGDVLLGAAIAYSLLTRALLTLHPADSPLAVAIGHDGKGKMSVIAYVLAVAVAFVEPWLSIGLYVAVAALWLLPDRRIERVAAPPPSVEEA